MELMGDLPRIELFARQQSPGWDVWGNEVESSLDMGKLQENSGKEQPEDAQPAAGKFLRRVILWRLSAYQKT